MTQYEDREIGAIILAAGKGKRMKSDLAKVLHPLCGKPMLTYSIDVARTVGVGKIAVVIGHQADVIRDSFSDQELIFIEQYEQLGTGHAVLQAKNIFRNFNGTILILCGDVPLLRPSTVRSLIEKHISGSATLTVLTTLLDDPSGYGRVIKRGPEAEVLRIVEEKDASPDEKKIREINTGIYCVESEFLFGAVEEIKNENVQKEYYLTDIVGIAWKKGFKTRTLIAANSIEVMGVNTLDDLERASKHISICK